VASPPTSLTAALSSNLRPRNWKAPGRESHRFRVGNRIYMAAITQVEVVAAIARKRKGLQPSTTDVTTHGAVGRNTCFARI
jgi:hypothetical protein